MSSVVVGGRTPHPALEDLWGALLRGKSKGQNTECNACMTVDGVALFPGTLPRYTPKKRGQALWRMYVFH